MASFLEISRDRIEEAAQLVLHPQVVESETVVFNLRHNSTWGGASVHDEPVWRSSRLRKAREYWLYNAVDMEYVALAGVYVLELRDGDGILCTWNGERTRWRWGHEKLEGPLTTGAPLPAY